jgi:ribosomal protein L14E/L6E/L27E
MVAQDKKEDLFIQIGRVVFINFGPSAGKIAVVLDIINDTTVD